MSRALFTGVSGLREHQEWLDVIGDNIANANTPGFKASSVTFTDILGQTLTTGQGPSTNKGGTNPVQIGLGVTMGAVTPNFLQGSLQTTNRNTDLAIQGDGFFVLTNGSDRVYTRAGAFTLDANGNMVDSASGWRVLGATGAIRINQGQESGAQATSTATFKGNLDFSVPDGTTHTATYDIRDSVGAAHTLTITFTKNFAGAPGRWDWAVTEGDAAITALDDGVQTAAGPPPVYGPASGSIVFDENGAIDTGASKDIRLTYGASSGVATPQTITLDFGSATNTSPMTGLASASTSTLSNQDGRAPGTLTSFTIGADGVITGFFSNSTTAVLDTVQIASFNNSSGLLKVGQNHWRESASSGTPAVGDPGTSNRGTLVSGALERSNVDLAVEFTSMIIAQRGFQANARTITTANEVLDELVNLRR